MQVNIMHLNTDVCSDPMRIIQFDSLWKSRLKQNNPKTAHQDLIAPLHRPALARQRRQSETVQEDSERVPSGGGQNKWQNKGSEHPR